jgi:hypothetical protein
MMVNGNTLSYSFTFLGYQPDGVSVFIGKPHPFLCFYPAYRLGDCFFWNSAPRIPGQCTIEGALELPDDQIEEITNGFWYVGGDIILGTGWEKRLPCVHNFLARVEQVPDTDHDGLPDYLDWCTDGPLGAIVDEHGCSIEQLCPRAGPWRNHGDYLNHLRAVSANFADARLITEEERKAILLEGAKPAAGRE